MKNTNGNGKNAILLVNIMSKFISLFSDDRIKQESAKF
jgi:hypothetical protein